MLPNGPSWDCSWIAQGFCCTLTAGVWISVFLISNFPPPLQLLTFLLKVEWILAGFEPVWEAGGKKNLLIQEKVSYGTCGAGKLQAVVVSSAAALGETGLAWGQPSVTCKSLRAAKVTSPDTGQSLYPALQWNTAASLSISILKSKDIKKLESFELTRKRNTSSDSISTGQKYVWSDPSWTLSTSVFPWVAARPS